MKYTLITLAVLGSLSVNAASFDCAKAGTKQEKLICSDGQLSQLDSELLITYKKVFGFVNAKT